jgi:hypothetical protein
MRCCRVDTHPLIVAYSLSRISDWTCAALNWAILRANQTPTRFAKTEFGDPMCQPDGCSKYGFEIGVIQSGDKKPCAAPGDVVNVRGFERACGDLLRFLTAFIQPQPVAVGAKECLCKGLVARQAADLIRSAYDFFANPCAVQDEIPSPMCATMNRCEGSRPIRTSRVRLLVVTEVQLCPPSSLKNNPRPVQAANPTAGS